MRQAAICLGPATLRDRLDDIAVIDVRTPVEFESVHLPHSGNRPLDELDDHVDEIRGLRRAGRPTTARSYRM